MLVIISTNNIESDADINPVPTALLVFYFIDLNVADNKKLTVNILLSYLKNISCHRG